MVLLAMPTPRRPLGLLPHQSPVAPNQAAGSTSSSITPDLASEQAPPIPPVPARNQGQGESQSQGQGQQLLSPVIGLLRVATASPVAAAAAAAAAVHALTSAAASATSPCMFAGGSSHASASNSCSSTSSSHQRLRTFSTTSCAPSPLMGLADDLVHALLHAGASSVPKHSHLLGTRSRTASLDHLGALRSSAMALSAISPHLVGGGSRPNPHSCMIPESRTNSLPMLKSPPTRFSPQPPHPFIASPPARVAAPAPPSSSSSMASMQQQQQQHQRQLPTPTLQISRAHQQQHHLPFPVQPFPTRPTRSSLPTCGRRSNIINKSLSSTTPHIPLYNSKASDDDILHLPTKPLGLLARSTTTGTYLHCTTTSTSSDLLDLGYLADSERDPASSHSFDHSPPFTPHSLLFAHPSPAPRQAIAPPPLPFASRAPGHTLILPPPIPIPSSSVHNNPYLPSSSRPVAPSLVCPQPTRSTSTFQFAVVPAYDPTTMSCSPTEAGQTSVSCGAEAFPVIAPSPIPRPSPSNLDSIKTPPCTFVMHPPSPISRPGAAPAPAPAPAAGAPMASSSPSPLLVPRLVAPRPVRALPASAAAVGIKNVLAHGLPPRTSPVSPMSPMVARAGVGASVANVADVGQFGG